MVQSVRPFLMFQGQAEEAMNLYVSLIPDSEIRDLAAYGPEGPGAEGSVVRAAFVMRGQEVVCIDSPVKHEFDFTPSFSFFVECESADELERLAKGLGEGGKVFMPLDSYGFSRRFTWIGDRFGVSWQLNLA